MMRSTNASQMRKIGGIFQTKHVTLFVVLFLNHVPLFGCGTGGDVGHFPDSHRPDLRISVYTYWTILRHPTHYA